MSQNPPDNEYQLADDELVITVAPYDPKDVSEILSNTSLSDAEQHALFEALLKKVQEEDPGLIAFQREVALCVQKYDLDAGWALESGDMMLLMGPLPALQKAKEQLECLYDVTVCTAAELRNNFAHCLPDHLYRKIFDDNKVNAPGMAPGGGYLH